MHSHRLVTAFGYAALAGLALFVGVGACSSAATVNVNTGGDGGPGGTCTSPTLADDDYAGCGTCTFSSSAVPSVCSAARSVNACCDWVQEPPMTGITRGTNLHYYSSTNATVDLGCLTTPASTQASTMVTLTGYVKLFADGQDSQGVKIELYKEGTSGALGTLVGSYTTTSTDPYVLEAWSSKCTAPGCNLRTYSIPNVPTYTPLIMRTSDANGSGLWADLYDYNIYISDPTTFGTTDPSCKAGADGGMGPMGGNATTAPPCYNASAVASTDINAVAATALGASTNPADGVLAGEVHDCGDVRLSGATVDTDQPHEQEMFYFDDNEDDPLPDSSRSTADQGTSTLGLFGALNMTVGVPTRVSATGYYNGTLTLLGTYVVQLFPGAVTALSLRGRRPFQTSP